MVSSSKKFPDSLGHGSSVSRKLGRISGYVEYRFIMVKGRNYARMVGSTNFVASSQQEAIKLVKLPERSAAKGLRV
jgi:hypothetical protein